MIAETVGESAAGNDAALATTAERLRRKLAQAPRHVAVAMSLLSAVFDWSATIWTGRRFRRLDIAEQRRHVTRWRDSTVGPLRDFVQFHEKLVIFIYYSVAARETSGR